MGTEPLRVMRADKTDTASVNYYFKKCDCEQKKKYQGGRGRWPRLEWAFFHKTE